MSFRYLLFLIVFLISGCVVFGYRHELPLESVDVYPGVTEPYQLRIPYRVEGRGNVHDLFSLKKYDYIDADWVSIGAANGVVIVESSSIQWCPDGKTKPFYVRRLKIKGKVVFSADTIKLDFQIQDKRDESGNLVWVPYKFNGTYRLNRYDSLSAGPPLVRITECLP